MDAKTEALLAKQGDVIASWQLAQNGVTAREVQALVDLGVFRSLPGRNLTTRRGALDSNARRWSGLLSAGPGGRLTGLSVLALAGICEREPPDVHVIVAGSAARKCPGVRRYRTTTLPDADCRLWGDLRGTTVARALVDAVADCTPDELDELLDRAIMLGLFDEAAIVTAMRARPSLPGLHKLTGALARLDEHSGHFLSLFERRVVRLVQGSTVIGPVVVNQIIDGLRPDIHRPGTSAIIECDGRDYHRSLAQVIADEVREEHLRRLGYRILRIRWAQLRYEPERTLARIEQFVLANSAPPVPVADETSTDTP